MTVGRNAAAISRRARRDTLVVLKGHEERLAIHGTEIDKIQKQLAAANQLEQVVENQIGALRELTKAELRRMERVLELQLQVLRDATTEELRRLREGIVDHG